MHYFHLHGQDHLPEFKAKVAIAAPKGDKDGGRTGTTVQCASELDYRLEKPVGGTLGGSFR